MEDLAEKWSNFSLSKREKTGFVLNKDQRSGGFIIAAQFLTPHFLNMEVMARTFKQLWRSTNGFKIRNHKDHMVLFVFDNLSDATEPAMEFRQTLSYDTEIQYRCTSP